MDYENLDLEAYDYQETGETPTFKVRVLSSPAGDQKQQDGVDSSLPADLTKRLRRLDERLLDRDQLIALGDDLGASLFPDGVREFLSDSRLVLGEAQGLRIRLKLDTYALANIPWEYAYITPPNTPAGQKPPDGFLALDRGVSLVRYEMQTGPMSPLEPSGPGPVRIAVLLSDPKAPPDYPPLDLDEEEQRIAKVFGRVTGLEPSYHPNATIDQLEEACEREPHVFHFAGHGTFEGDLGDVYGTLVGKGYLVLLDDQDHPLPFPVEKLALVLKGQRVRLAVLGACNTGRRDAVNAWSGIAPALTRAGIPAVVGMQYKIRDNNAIAFSWKLYKSLMEQDGCIDDAVTAGRLGIYLRGGDDERDWGVPVLYLRAKHGNLFPRVPGLHGAGEHTPASGPGTVSFGTTGYIAGASVFGMGAGSPSGALPLLPCPNPACNSFAATLFCLTCGTRVWDTCSSCGGFVPASATYCGLCGHDRT